MSGTAGLSQATATLPQDTVKALQAALEAEHAAVYGYGIVGARFIPATADRALAQAAYNAHRARRDRLAQLVTETGRTPVSAAPAYTLPFPVTDPAEATRLALHLEEGIATVYADLVHAGSGEIREFGAQALSEAAVRAARWRRGSVPFPGLPERATPAPGTPAPGVGGTS